jgi:hypothetical protein
LTCENSYVLYIHSADRNATFTALQTEMPHYLKNITPKLNVKKREIQKDMKMKIGNRRSGVQSKE